MLKKNYYFQPCYSLKTKTETENNYVAWDWLNSTSVLYPQHKSHKSLQKHAVKLHLNAKYTQKKERALNKMANGGMCFIRHVDIIIIYKIWSLKSSFPWDACCFSVVQSQMVFFRVYISSVIVHQDML